MAKIVKVDLNLGQKKIVNPFKTSRNSHTNPFAFEDFEGNTLDPMLCADVLVKDGTAKTNKIKLIASSVAGSMTKFRTSITEPIANFVRRIRTGISGAWDYAKNTDVLDVAKNINTTLRNDITSLGKGITDKFAGIKHDLTGNITDLGKGISEKWNTMIEHLKPAKKISSSQSVAELKALWLEENRLAANKEAA